MKPLINTQPGGKVVVGDQTVSYDFFINTEGEIVRRVKSAEEITNLKEVSLTEAADYYDPNINEMIIGWRSDDKLKLSEEAIDYLDEKKCKVKLLPLQEAITYWNRYEGRAVGLFHIVK